MTSDPRVLQRMPWLMGLTLGTMGAVMPFLAVELRARGLEGEALTLTLTAIPIARVFLGPLWGALADRYQAEGRTLQAASAVMAFGVAGLLFGPHALAWLAAMVFTFGNIGVIPVLDGLTVKALGGDASGYGRVRRWGSLGFLLLVLASGVFKDELGQSPLWLGLSAACVAAALTWTLPGAEAAPRVAVWPALRRLAQDGALTLLLIAAALHMAGMSVYHLYYAVHAEDLGLSAGLTSAAISGGIVVEIALMSYAPALLRRLGPAPLFLLAAGVTLPRWLATAYVSSAAGQVALQLLHGVSFGAAWLGLVALVSQRAPKDIASSAQGLLGGTVGGLGAILGTACGGMLLDTYGGPEAFLGAAALSLGSLLFCGAGLALERRVSAAAG
ncbi:MAG: MFS transporter [Alphaproteobacteria bacterium]|nr:MFS transporter [Alphaproteobacteria bacterium]